METDPVETAAPRGKAPGPPIQPWRALLPLLDAAIRAPGDRPAGVGRTVDQKRERGILPDEQVDVFARLMKETYGDKPWYDYNQDDGGCSTCGNSPCTCSVFEGG